MKFAPLVELLHEWSSPITDDGSICGNVLGLLNLESVFVIANAALLFPENENGIEFIPFVSEIEPPNNGNPTKVAAVVVDVENILPELDKVGELPTDMHKLLLEYKYMVKLQIENKHAK